MWCLLCRAVGHSLVSGMCHISTLWHLFVMFVAVWCSVGCAFAPHGGPAKLLLHAFLFKHTCVLVQRVLLGTVLLQLSDLDVVMPCVLPGCCCPVHAAWIPTRLHAIPLTQSTWSLQEALAMRVWVQPTMCDFFLKCTEKIIHMSCRTGQPLVRRATDQ